MRKALEEMRIEDKKAALEEMRIEDKKAAKEKACEEYEKRLQQQRKLIDEKRFNITSELQRVSVALQNELDVHRTQVAESYRQ